MLKSGIRVNPEEISAIYSIIDEDNSNTISLKEFFDVISGRRRLDVTGYIAEKRKRAGLNIGISPEELAAQKKVSMGPNIISNESRSVGSVDGLSSLMKRTEDKSVEIPQLIDESEPYRNFTEIKEAFMTKCFTFEDLL
jgi:hypothetical protein